VERNVDSYVRARSVPFHPEAGRESPFTSDSSLTIPRPTARKVVRPSLHSVSTTIVPDVGCRPCSNLTTMPTLKGTCATAFPSRPRQRHILLLIETQSAVGMRSRANLHPTHTGTGNIVGGDRGCAARWTADLRCHAMQVHLRPRRKARNECRV
jgi:hypothetical protein